MSNTKIQFNFFQGGDHNLVAKLSEGAASACRMHLGTHGAAWEEGSAGLHGELLHHVSVIFTKIMLRTLIQGDNSGLTSKEEL